jgi:phosphatidate cytidylyltransferase
MPLLLLVVGAIWARFLFCRSDNPISAIGTTLLGVLYIPFMLTWLIKIPLEHGMTMLFYTVAVIKISDMGGFAFGMAFGKHKMCPSISPGKSWEGLGGSIFGSILISCLFIPWTRFSWCEAVGFGVLAALVGTFGDLVESRFKRECGVKDSATFMPAGLGGFLDMFDSLVFAPALFYLLFD